jgi:molybdopterin-guanine dinucleotide biosynthesis protein A
VGTFGAVVLAGGAGRRLGGRDKPAVAVGGVPMLARVLEAVRDASPRIIVGPDRVGLPAGVRCVLEQPSGMGPVAALAAAAPLVTAERLALLAADLPGLTADAVRLLDGKLAGSRVDGAVFVDDGGRRQLLCGVWYTRALHDRLAAIGEPAGRSLRDLVAPLRVAEVTWIGDGLPPWFDCDTDEDLRRAGEYLR